jgi:DNA invertase Pin-like site-specific DNA recombinase
MFIRTVQKEVLTMAKIGYARVSSKEQHLDRQLAALKGVDKLFTDKLSGANTNRPELQKMLAYIREGDIVMVTELDRLGRNNHDLTKIMNSIQNKGATLDVLNLPSMTGIADPNLRQLMTNLIIELYKYQAESERKRIIERQQQGIALAKQQGKYHGRKPQYTQDDSRLQHAFKLYRAGMSDIDVSRNTGIKRTTFIRYRVKYGIKRK